jgi:hypothetical protein
MFGEKRAYPHLETSKLEEGFLLQTKLILIVKKCARVSCF